MQYRDLMKKLRLLASAQVRASMERFGVKAARAHGIDTPTLKAIARQIGRDHDLALKLWDSGVFEARVIAFLIDEPEKVSRGQMERWVKAFDSWAICDGCCCYLFRKTPFARPKIAEWTRRENEYIKRAGFALIAYLAVHDKQADDGAIAEFLPLIEREATDNRPYVRKAVNWALRQIGKRNSKLNRLTIEAAKRIRAQGTPAARWIAADALRELQDKKVQSRLKKRPSSSRPEA